MRTQRARSDAVARSDRGEVRHWQIGPKIRIGGTVGKIGEKIKSNLPFLMAPAGLGATIQGEVIKHGTDPTKVAEGFVDDLKTGAKNVPGVVGAVGSGVFGKDTVTGGNPIPNAPAGGDDPTGMGDPSGADGAIPSGSKGTGQDWLDILKSFGGDAVKAAAAFASKYGATALEIANIANAAHRQGEADKYGKAALAGTEQRFADKAGLRSSGIAGMQNPGTGADLSNLKAIANAPRDPSKLANIAGPQSGNPFAGAVPPRGAIPNAPAAPPQVYDRPNPMAGATIPLAPPPTLAAGQNPATGQRPQPAYDPRKLPLPIATRLGG